MGAFLLHPCSHFSSFLLFSSLFFSFLFFSTIIVFLTQQGDPEHAYTNITAHAGGVVFCSFSTPNLAYWHAISVSRHVVPLRIPTKGHDQNHVLDNDVTYIMFETNEGDTPRILTSQFTSAWLSPNRGIVPVAWAVDPLLGKMFPELWNYFMNTTTCNDTFLAGVDGGGYVYLDSLGEHAAAYEERAGGLFHDIGPNVVDVGVPQYGWPAVKISRIQEYVDNIQSAQKRGNVNVTVPDLFVNACGSDWNESINTWLPNDGPVVVSSVCVGPPGNDTSNGHYLYYYRDHLNPTNPISDLSWRITWASQKFKKKNEPLFLLVFGGLGLYGGHKDYFEFLNDVMEELNGTKYVAVGAQEMARLAKEARPMVGAMV